MEQWKQVRTALHLMMDILSTIEANTETLSRFVRKRAITGLNRVLRERAVLIDELTVLNGQLISETSWKRQPELMVLWQAIGLKQQEILRQSGLVVRQAMAEKADIADEIRQIRVKQQVRSRYVHHWAVLVPGRQINEKG